MAGGAAGSVLRFVAVNAIMQRFAWRFPLGTVLVNITGSFLIGLLMTILSQRQAGPEMRLLLVVGVLGGYTTFSSFEFETFQAVRAGAAWIGLLNVLGSVIFGYLAVWCGAALVRR